MEISTKGAEGEVLEALAVCKLGLGLSSGISTIYKFLLSSVCLFFKERETDIFQAYLETVKKNIDSQKDID